MSAKLKRIVAHPKLYLAVGGVLHLVPKGTEITVTEEQAKRLGKKLSDPSGAGSVDVTEEGSTQKPSNAKK